MNISTEIREDHQAALTVEFEISDLERAKRIAAKKIGRKTKIPGFRPGKAPYNLIVRYIGETSILEEAVDNMVEEHYPSIIEQSEITPYGPGSLTNIASVAPPTFEFLVPMAPKVEIGDYKSIEMPYLLEEVTQEEYEESLENLRAQRAEMTTVERASEEGDIVYVDVTGKEEDAEENLLDDKRVPYLLNKKDENGMAWPFVGAQDLFYGLEKGDEVNAEHSFSEDEEVEETFRGKTVQFTFKMDEVRARELPELNDAFAQTLGEYESFEAFDVLLREDLAEHKKNHYEETYETELTDKIIGLSTIKHPPQMLEDEIGLLLEQLKSRLANQGLNLDIYMKSRNLDEEGLREELIPVADGRLHRNLVLLEIARLEDIQVSDEEVQAEVTKTVNSLASTMPPEEANRLFSDKKTMEGLVSNVMGNTIFRKTLARLRAIANGEVDETPEEEAAEPEAAEPVAEVEEETGAVAVKELTEETVAAVEDIETKDAETAGQETEPEVVEKEEPAPVAETEPSQDEE